MGIKSILSLPFAKYIVFKNSFWKNNAVRAQQKVMFKLVAQAKNTVFGADHSFSKINNYSDFKNNIPIRPWYPK